MAGKRLCPTCGLHWTPNDMCWHCRSKKEAHTSPYKDIEVSKWKPKRTKRILTDAEQLKINKTVDERRRLTFESRQYTPGTPEFEAIVETLTPVERISRKSIECQVNEVWGK